MAVAKVAWTDQKGAARELSVKIEDTSRSGACIRISVPISLESKLMVDWREGCFSGVARYCRADGEEYSVGIQRDVPEAVAQAKVSTEVTTRTIEPAASEATREALGDAAAAPKQIGQASPADRIREEVPVFSVMVHEGVTHEDSGDEKTQYTSDLAVWRDKQPKRTDRARFTERPLEQAPRREERSHMLSKWLNLGPKQERKDVPNGNSNGASGPNSGARVHAELPHDLHARPSRKGSAVPQGDLLPLDDVYRATGIAGARAGYNVLKVVEMLGSSHIRELPDELRRASVLMALDAAGVSVEEILRDARLRLEALVTYEADQQKRLKESEARKLQENAEIQLEMERVNEHYLERMNHNLDEVAAEKDPFAKWQAMKQQEVQRISEAVGLCEKRANSGSSSAASSESLSDDGAGVAAPGPSASNARHEPVAAIKGRGHVESGTLDA